MAGFCCWPGADGLACQVHPVLSAWWILWSVLPTLSHKMTDRLTFSAVALTYNTAACELPIRMLWNTPPNKHPHSSLNAYETIIQITLHCRTIIQSSVCMCYVDKYGGESCWYIMQDYMCFVHCRLGKGVCYANIICRTGWDTGGGHVLYIWNQLHTYRHMCIIIIMMIWWWWSSDMIMKDKCSDHVLYIFETLRTLKDERL